MPGLQGGVLNKPPKHLLDYNNSPADIMERIMSLKINKEKTYIIASLLKQASGVKQMLGP